MKSPDAFGPRAARKSGARALALALTFGCALAGCQPSRGTRDESGIEVTMLAPDRFEFRGRQADRARLLRALKRSGAGPETTIRVGIPADMPPADLADLAGDLASAGYRRVVFVRPRTFKSTTGEARNPARR